MDVAFTPQISEFRGVRSPQLNVVDIRPACRAECSCDCGDYAKLRRNTLTAQAARRLLPDRATLSMVWRYLASRSGTLQETPVCLCRKIVRWADRPLNLSSLMTCLDIFRDVGLLETQQYRKYIRIRVLPYRGKADLTGSATYRRLPSCEESE